MGEAGGRSQHVHDVVVGGVDPLRVGVDEAEGARIFRDVDQFVDRADDEIGNAGLGDDGNGRQGFAGIDRPDDVVDLLAKGQLLREIDRFRRIAGGVAHDKLELAALDAAGGVDLIDSELHTDIFGDRRRRERTRHRGEPTDADRLRGADGYRQQRQNRHRRKCSAEGRNCQT